MEKLLCKLIAVFFSIGLAVSAQATLIVNDSSDYTLMFKSDYFPLEKVASGQSNNDKGTSEKSATGKLVFAETQHNAKLNAGRFSGNVLSIFQEVNALTQPVYDSSFVNEAREFERERFNFSLDSSGTLGNLLDRVKVNTHVPESTSIMLFAVGLFSLAMARRKMKA